MKKSFTLLEMIFVIVVVGILAVVMLPKIENNSLNNAAIQLLSDIRYTQHLAIVDDKFNAQDSNWYKKRWQILFAKSSSGSKNTGGYYAYSIFSDKATYTGKPGITEMAKNPFDNVKLLSGGYSGVLNWKDPRATRKLNLGESYGIDDMNFSCGKRLAFDHIGRPIKGNLSTMTGSYHAGTDRLFKKQCVITLIKGTKSISIDIEPESGYASIVF